MGVMLAPEIQSILRSSAKKVIIGGKPQLKTPMGILLKHHGKKEILPAEDLSAECAAAYGAVKIYEHFLKTYAGEESKWQK